MRSSSIHALAHVFAFTYSADGNWERVKWRNTDGETITCIVKQSKKDTFNLMGPINVRVHVCMVKCKYYWRLPTKQCSENNCYSCSMPHCCCFFYLKTKVEYHLHAYTQMNMLLRLVEMKISIILEGFSCLLDFFIQEYSINSKTL